MPAVTPESPKVISPELADPLIWVELSDLVPEIIACELWVFVSVALIVISPEAAEIETLVPGFKFSVLSAFCVNLTASVPLPLICK